MHPGGGGREARPLAAVGSVPLVRGDDVHRVRRIGQHVGAARLAPLFDFANLTSVVNVPQTNNATANNVALGFFVGPQTIAQVQGNVANVGVNQQANP